MKLLSSANVVPETSGGTKVIGDLRAMVGVVATCGCLEGDGVDLPAYLNGVNPDAEWLAATLGLYFTFPCNLRGWSCLEQIGSTLMWIIPCCVAEFPACFFTGRGLSGG